MPLYYFRCLACDVESRKLLTPEQSKDIHACPKCQSILLRTPKPPTANVVETLDNNWMTKRVERPADAERLIKERSDKAGQED